MRKTRDLTLMAMYLALYVVLAKYSELFIPFLRMPSGGSIELSTIVILIASYQLGVKKALIVALGGVFLEYTIGGKAFYGYNGLQIFLDYILAFGIYAFASVLPVRNNRIPVGVIFTSIIRFLAHTTSGVLYFPIESDSIGAIWYASASYNLPYMLVNMILGFMVVLLILPPIQRGLNGS